MYKRILVPIDGSDLSLRAAEAGIDLARSEGAAVTGLYVTTPYSVPYVYPGDMTFPYPSKDEYEQCVKREAEAYLDQLAAYAAAADVTWDQLIISSHATAPTIVETAKHCKSDLIVMGSHGRGGVGQLLLGSVTNKVLAACHIPVLVHRGGKKLARRHTPVAKRTAGSHALVI